MIRELSTTHERKGGRPRKDGGDKGWVAAYCRAYLETNGNYGKAAKATPYSVRQIQEFLDPNASSYDPEFAQEVKALDFILAGELQEKFIGLTDESNFVDFDTAKITQTKGWVLSKALAALDAKWGRRSEVTVKGDVTHHHRLEAKPRTEILAELEADRRRYFNSVQAQQKALPVKSEAVEVSLKALEPIEAEVIEDPAT